MDRTGKTRTQAAHKIKNRIAFRTIFGAAAAVVGLLGLFVLANSPPRIVNAAGWQSTDYPYPAVPTQPEGLQTLDPYPFPGDPTTTSVVTASPTLTGQATLTPGGPTVTPSPTLGLATPIAVTPGRDLFATENAEMGGALVTLPPSETPTMTFTASVTAQPTPTVAAGFQLNRRLFLIGILVPLTIAIVGGLLYRFLKSPEFY